MYRNSVTTLVLHSKEFQHKLAKKRRKMQVFLLADFRSISDNYVVLVQILVFKILYVSYFGHNIGITFERFSQKLAKKKKKNANFF